jgi:outer membrane protein OmpA-like peptidoglycan-associated protein
MTKKNVLALVRAVCAAMPLAAQSRGFSFGLGGEANAVSLELGGYGALFAAESRLNRWFSLAVLGGASLQNTSGFADLTGGTAFIGMEASAFARWYFLSSPDAWRSGGVEVFAGLGGGALVAMNGTDPRNSRGSPAVSGILGARFNLGDRFYIEPYVRGGIPSVGGAGLLFGFRFPVRSEAGPPQIVEVERVVEVERIVEVERVVEAERVVETERVVEVESPLNEVFVFIFPPNAARFNDLDEAAAQQNNQTLSRLLTLLEENPGARMLLEGFANPVLGTVLERETLQQLSERRVSYIAVNIIGRGIAADRLLQIGEGGSHPIVARDERERWEQNRRVEVRLLLPLKMAEGSAY